MMDDDAGGLNNNGANMTNYYLKLHYMVAMMTAPSSNFFFSRLDLGRRFSSSNNSICAQEIENIFPTQVERRSRWVAGSRRGGQLPWGRARPRKSRSA